MTLSKTFPFVLNTPLIPQTSRPQHPDSLSHTHTHTHTEMLKGEKYSTFTNIHTPLSSGQIGAVSQLLEMWQLRRALDMQASALWLISTAQLCRAIAAWLALQESFLFSPPPPLSDSSSLPLRPSPSQLCSPLPCPWLPLLLIAVWELHY